METSVSTTQLLKFLMNLFIVVSFLCGSMSMVGATDADPLQDYCIADKSANFSTVNGYPCQDPTLATTEDFAFAGLATAANLTGDFFDAAGVVGSVLTWPALNTLGLALARLDLNPGGVILPHTHPRASEILFCLEGEIYTGFVTNSDFHANPNKLFAKIVKAGEAFVYPRGLLHFQFNKGTKHAVALNIQNSQNPGVQLIPIALFGTGIDPELLEKALFLNETELATLAAIFTPLVPV